MKSTFGAMPWCSMYKLSSMGMEGMKCEPVKLYMHYGVIDTCHACAVHKPDHNIYIYQ